MGNQLKNLGSEKLVNDLLAAGNRRKFSPGESVFDKGDRADFLPVVLSGRVKIYRFLTPGKEVIINVFDEGEVFAIPPVLDGKGYPASAVALDETELLMVSRNRFLNLLNKSEEFSKLVMSRMSGLLRETTRSIENLANGSPEERIANILLWLAEKEGTSDPVTISLRRQDIAQIAGLATETTIRTIRKLAEDGIVSIVKGKIILDERRKLEVFLKA